MPPEERSGAAGDRALYAADSYLRRCPTCITECRAEEAGGGPALGVRLESTVLYPRGGGQPADSGMLTLAVGEGRRFPVVDVHRDDARSGAIWHRLGADAAGGSPANVIEVGLDVIAEVDWPRRWRHMRMHTALHLLCAIVDAPVTGCGIGEARSRIDFDHAAPLSKDAITSELIARIEAARPVTISRLSAASVQARPNFVRTRAAAPPVAGGWVRVVSIEGMDRQPCGGTHVRNTSEIGAIVCRKVEKKGKRNRRVQIAFADEA